MSEMHVFYAGSPQADDAAMRAPFFTVAELIAKLAEFPPDMPVGLIDDYGDFLGWPIGDVKAVELYSTDAGSGPDLVAIAPDVVVRDCVADDDDTKDW